jgi:DNA-binding winged helix-turn-helix (wHTH) protein
VQGVAFEGIERSIDGHIKNLRAKIEPDPRSPIFVETVYGVGYRFNMNADKGQSGGTSGALAIQANTGRRED